MAGNEPDAFKLLVDAAKEERFSASYSKSLAFLEQKFLTAFLLGCRFFIISFVNYLA
jgi:hypothetical protein